MNLQTYLPTFLKAVDITPHDNDMEGRFWHCTPNFANIADFVRTNNLDQCIPRPINTVHIGTTGAGKSTLISALQKSGATTAVPNHTSLPAVGQSRLHETRIGRSMDTDGLGDPRQRNVEQNRQNLIRLLDSDIGDVHGIFTHVKVSNKSDDVFVDTVNQALMLADDEARNIIVIISFSKPVYRVIADTFRREAAARGLHLRDIVIVNLTVTNVEDDTNEETEIKEHFSSNDESCFDYRFQRDELLLFTIALMHRNFDLPIRVQHRRQTCGRNCGNAGIDSRCFVPKCHHQLEAAHPPRSGTTAEEYELPHTGVLEPPEHWDIVRRRPGEFKSGLTPAVASGVIGPIVNGLVATAVGGLATKAFASTLLVYPTAHLASSVVGFGIWSCCSRLRNGKLTGKSEGCRRRWSCCGEWQDGEDELAKVACTRKVCRFCRGDYDKPPADDSLEMRCSNPVCKRGEENGYVGIRHEGVQIAPPCKTLRGGERHKVQDLPP